MHSLKNSSEFIQIKSHYQQGFPFAIFCGPHANRITAVLQNDKVHHRLSDFVQSGFLASPFVSESRPTLIRPDQVFEFEFVQEPLIDKTKKLDADTSGRDAYISLVNKALVAINKGYMKKVVLAHSFDAETKKSEFELFQSLLVEYPNAFRYLFYHPQIGLWMGATPERFLRLQHNEVETVSLAGTLPVDQNSKPNWSSKERDEQALVTEHIVSVLKQYSQSIKVHGPENQQAGNLWHLKSTITAQLANWEKVGALVDELHPTPAVCGLPVEAAKNFLLQNENLDRELYTGYLGPINLHGHNTIELCVNLRCMQFNRGKAKIYVGAGITKDSNPESEWNETENKSRTILNLL